MSPQATQAPPDPPSPVEIGLSPEPSPGLPAVPDPAEMPLPSDPQTVFLAGLFGMAALALLYVASSIILPVVLAFGFQLLLQPAVHLLSRVHVPRPVGALLVIVVVLGSFGGL